MDELSSAHVGELRRLELEGGDELDVELVAVGDQALVARKIDDAFRYDGFVWVPRSALVRARVFENSDRLGRWLAAERRPAGLGLEARADRSIDWAVDSGELVAVHDEQPGPFLVGWLRARDKAVVIDEVLADGSPRLGTTVRVAEVQRLEWGSRYLEAVRLLHELADEASVLAPYIEATRPAAIDQMLSDALHSGALVHVVRKREPGWYSGSVVGLGRSLVVLRELDEESLEIDGYMALRRDCITKVALDQKHVGRTRVLQARGQSIAAPRVWPSSIPDLLLTLARPDRESAPLVAVQDDDPRASFVGHLIECPRGGDTTMHYVAPFGIDDGTYSLPTDSIATVEWDSRYLAAVEGMRRL